MEKTGDGSIAGPAICVTTLSGGARHYRGGPGGRLKLDVPAGGWNHKRRRESNDGYRPITVNITCQPPPPLSTPGFFSLVSNGPISPAQ